MDCSSKQTIFRVILSSFFALVMAIAIPEAQAFNFYSDLNSGGSSSTGGCADCHTAFRKGGTYTSQAEGVSWGDTLHNVHLNNTDIGSNCGNCHFGANTNGRGMNLSSSQFGPGSAPALACMGCHGRLADANALGPNGNGWGAGLRQHHNSNGVGICLTCHLDADPGNFTVAGEDTMPEYYPNVTNTITST
ncbi:MAG: multiheme c-type cytochrome, partial [Planctomycetota bacterium]